MSQESPVAPTILSKSLQAATSLIALQLLSRSTTFILNQALVRLSSPESFGTASIQFELLLSTILFLSREGVRNSVLRSQSSASQSFTNISTLPVLLGLPIAIITSTAYMLTASSETRAQPFFVSSVLVFTLAAVLELLSEPLYIKAQNELRWDIRVRAEGAAVILKAASTVAFIVAMGEKMALLGFAIGQCVYGTSILLAFVRAYPGSLQLWPTKITEKSDDIERSYYFDDDLLRLSLATSGQSVFKHLLTEGDKIIISRIGTLEDQGGYAIASNYGSLVARIVFQPIEETTRTTLSKTLSKGSTNVHAADSATTVLSLILLSYAHFTLLLLSFAPPYLPVVLSFILPSRYQSTSAPQILSLYPMLLPLMAFNGILEAFHSATSTPGSLASQSKFLVALSLGCSGLVWVLRQSRAALVWANAGNMLGRTLWAALWARTWGMTKWKDCLPPMSVLAAFVLGGIITRWSSPRSGGIENLRRIRKDDIVHIGMGIMALAGVAIVCFISERIFVRSQLRSLRRKD